MNTHNEVERLTKAHHHELRDAAAVSGAVVGSVLGLVGGPVGFAVGGFIGGVVGAASGVVLEHESARAAARDRDRDAVIEIEPPCAECVEVRRESAGTVVTCARHTHAPRLGHHLHYEYPASFAVGMMLLRPR